MEIEAKFLVPDKSCFDNILKMDKISGFSQQNIFFDKFRDTYLDSLDMAIYASGFSFRSRVKNEKTTYTLKSLENQIYQNRESVSSIRMRDETEITMQESIPFNEWDNCNLKKKIIDIVGKGELFDIFSVYHKRKDIKLYDGKRHIAEMSFDDVTIKFDGNESPYLELEVELMGDGTMFDLQRIVSFLRDDIGLSPGGSSKFENGFELLKENVLRDAYYLDYKFKGKDADIKFSTLWDMFDEYNIEIEHARKVAENSFLLFENLGSIHGLDYRLRHTLKIAALVHDIGVMTDFSTHHKIGRDILFKNCPKELPYPLYHFLPWISFLHNKRIGKKKIQKLLINKYFSQLPVNMQYDILRMAAIIRIADALDYSRMDSKIVDIDVRAEDVTVKITGKGTDLDVDRADRKADLWCMIFEKPIFFRKGY